MNELEMNELEVNPNVLYIHNKSLLFNFTALLKRFSHLVRLVRDLYRHFDSLC
jgi:hypothetical protein